MTDQRTRDGCLASRLAQGRHRFESAHPRVGVPGSPPIAFQETGLSGKVAFREAVEYNEPPPTGRAGPGDTMLEELIQKADAEFKRIQRLRGYL